MQLPVQPFIRSIILYLLQNMSLLDLPSDVLTSIFCDWCDGKAISTFLLTQCNKDHCVTRIVQGALVARIDQLAKRITRIQTQDDHDNEILHVLGWMREKLKETTTSIQLYSEQCAILDYFEGHDYHQHCHDNDDKVQVPNNYIVYVGKVATSWGDLNIWITAPTWSLHATHAMYHEYELAYFSLVRPDNTALEYLPPYFGTMFGLTNLDATYLDRVREKCEGYPELYKCMLTASSCSFEDEPPLIFTPHSIARTQYGITKDTVHNKSLCCFWEQGEGLEDDAMTHLAENAIRIMERFVEGTSSGTGKDTFRQMYATRIEAMLLGTFEEEEDEEDFEEEVEEEFILDPSMDELWGLMEMNDRRRRTIELNLRRSI